MSMEYKLSLCGKEIDEKLLKVDDALLVTKQTLTDEQKAQARENIRAVPIETVNYNLRSSNIFDGVFEYGSFDSNTGAEIDLNPSYYGVRARNYLAVEGGKNICFNRMDGLFPNNIRIVEYDKNKDVCATPVTLLAQYNKYTNMNDVVTLSTNTKYIRFTAYSSMGMFNGIDLSTIYVNLYYVEDADKMWAPPGDVFIYVEPFNAEPLGDFIPESYIRSSLTGKKIIYDGDSICASHNNNGGAYAKIIADKVNGTYDNFAVGGARLTTAGENGSYHSIVDNLVNLPLDGDIYCFEGGINDFWTPKTLGTYDKTDFVGELDTNTVCGALETIFRYSLNTFVGKPICFVITHKIQNTAYNKNSNNDTFENYHDAMVGICNKYSIPYYDAFLNSGLNGWNNTQNDMFLTANTDGTPDGCHPNEDGYRRYYVPHLLDLFQKIMPVI